jgi:CHASE3 domain sensor protein
VGSTQDGLGGVEGQLRDHGTLLVHLSNELKHLRSQMDADRTDREAAAQQLAAEIASLRRGVLILTGLAGLVVVGVVWVILLLIPTHHP